MPNKKTQKYIKIVDNNKDNYSISNGKLIVVIEKQENKLNELIKKQEELEIRLKALLNGK